MRLHNNKLYAISLVAVLSAFAAGGQIVCVDDLGIAQAGVVGPGSYYAQEFVVLTNGVRCLKSVDVGFVFNSFAVAIHFPTVLKLYSTSNGVPIGAGVSLGSVVAATNGYGLYSVPLSGTNYLREGVYAIGANLRLAGSSSCQWEYGSIGATNSAPGGIFLNCFSSNNGITWTNQACRLFMRVVLADGACSDSAAKVTGVEPYMLFTLGFLCIKLILLQFS